MKAKKIVSLLLTLIMMLMFTACGDWDNSNIKGTVTKEYQNGEKISSKDKSKNAGKIEYTNADLLEYYGLDDGSGLCVCGGDESIQELNIPEEIDGIPVVDMSTRAFYGDNLKSVTIPGSIRGVSYSSFGSCNKLASVTILDGPVRIGEYAFSNCGILQSITIPTSIEQICCGAFNKCSMLKDVYYAGTEADWNNINIESGNEHLLNATIHFNSEF